MKNVNYNAGAACQSENFLLPRYLWKIIDYYCCPLKLRPSRARVCMHMQALKNKKLG